MNGKSVASLRGLHNALNLIRVGRIRVEGDTRLLVEKYLNIKDLKKHWSSLPWDKRNTMRNHANLITKRVAKALENG